MLYFRNIVIVLSAVKLSPVLSQLNDIRFFISRLGFNFLMLFFPVIFIKCYTFRSSINGITDNEVYE